MTFENLIHKYRRLGEECARLSAMVNAAAVCTEVIHDLETFRATEDAAELDLRDASTVSGYSTDHLRRLVREGRLTAMRRGRQLFFRAGDLPTKARRVDAVQVSAYDPIADARQVAAQRIPGGIHGSQTAA
jgi:hypothetical protein